MVDRHCPRAREQRPDVAETVAHIRDLADQIHEAARGLYAEIARLEDDDQDGAAPADEAGAGGGR